MLCALQAWHEGWWNTIKRNLLGERTDDVDAGVMGESRWLCRISVNGIVPIESELVENSMRVIFGPVSTVLVLQHVMQSPIHFAVCGRLREGFWKKIGHN
jgi:hypothetical protein